MEEVRNVPVRRLHGRTRASGLGRRALWIAGLALVVFTAGCVTIPGRQPQSSTASVKPVTGSGGGGESAKGSSTDSLIYTPAPNQVVRTDAEKQLAARSENFNNVMMGGILAEMLARSTVESIACQSRYSKNPKARNDCVAAALLRGTINGARKGYAAAVLDDAGQNRVRAAQKVTADMTRDNENLQAVIDSSDKVLAESNARLAQLKSDVQTRKVAASQAKQDAQREQANLDLLKASLEDAKKNRDTYQQAASQIKADPEQKRNLDAEIAKMNAKVKTLEANVKKLSDAMVPFSG